MKIYLVLKGEKEINSSVFSNCAKNRVFPENCVISGNYELHINTSSKINAGSMGNTS